MGGCGEIHSEPGGSECEIAIYRLCTLVRGLVTSSRGVMMLHKGRVGPAWRVFVRVHFHGALREVFCIVEATVMHEREIGIHTMRI